MAKYTAVSEAAKLADEMRWNIDYHEKERQKSVAALERVTKFQQTLEESLRGLDGDV